MNYKKESGARLRKARIGAKLTLDELSRRLGGMLSASRLSNYEQGLRTLGIKESILLSNILSVPAAHLLCVDEEEGEMTPQEARVIRNFSALPENLRSELERHIEVLSLAYRKAGTSAVDHPPIATRKRRQSSQK
jgi:transcriptional regulator with XRE-family HTH domain